MIDEIMRDLDVTAEDIANGSRSSSNYEKRVYDDYE